MEQLLTELPFGFPGRVYRSPMPFGDFDPFHQVLQLYQQHGIQVVVMLLSSAEATRITGRDLLQEYQMHGMQVIPFPMPDFDVPEVEPLRAALETTYRLAQEGRTIAVHCHAGLGRTGLFLACLAGSRLGFSASQAVRWVRQSIPHAIENTLQLNFIENYLAVDGSN